MCLICIEYEKKKLTAKEAYRNLGEMKDVIKEEHLEEVMELIWEDLWESFDFQSGELMEDPLTMGSLKKN